MPGWLRPVILLGLLVAAPAPLPAQQAVPAEVIARNLAENVLGEGTVKRVRVVRDGRIVVIVWETVLYRDSNTRERNREQLRGEAELATGSIMGVMHPETIQYAILSGQKMLASGQRTRDGGFTIKYAKELGG